MTLPISLAKSALPGRLTTIRTIHEDFRKDSHSGRSAVRFGNRPGPHLFGIRSLRRRSSRSMSTVRSGATGIRAGVCCAQVRTPFMRWRWSICACRPGWGRPDDRRNESGRLIQRSRSSFTAYSDSIWNEIASRLGVTDRLLILRKPFDSIEVQQIASTTRKWS